MRRSVGLTGQRSSWKRSGLLATVLSLPLAAPLFAQASQPGAGTKSSGGGQAEPAQGAAQDAFDRQFAEWKAMLADIRKIQEQFQVASAQHEREALAKKFSGLLAQGRAMAPKLVETAERAFAENPRDASLADFLAAVAVEDVGSSDKDGNDKYEEAYRIGKALAAAGTKNPALYNALGVAAFCVNDYSLARKYLDLADAEKSLSPIGADFRRNLEDIEKLWAKESKIREAEAKADDLPRVKIVTTKGDIVVELFENEAPNTTANFISLVEKGFYKQSPFHRVLGKFMAQGGAPADGDSGGPDYTIACECYQPNHRAHFRGSLSMALSRSSRDTGGSQFFLTFVPASALNGKHTVFGRIVEGMDVLARIQRIDPEKSKGVKPDLILDAVVLRKRNHPYVPVKKGP